MASITDREIAGAIRKARQTGGDVYLTDAAKARGIGRLRVRARASGLCLFYFRYVDSSSKQDSIALGVYDITGKSGLTLRQARDKAGECSRLYQSGRRDLRAHLDHAHAEEKARIETAARARAEAERQAKSGTLKAMLDGYVAHLERQSKTASSRDARNLFRHNIYDKDTFPHLAAMRASQISHEDISAILARLINRGAGRSAAKLRAYLRAAFGAALQASSDPTVHPDLHGFHLTGNPAAVVPAKPLARFNKARERALNVSELRAFMTAVGMAELLGAPGAKPAKADEKAPVSSELNRDVLCLTLLLGGQRLAQLVRVRPADVDEDEQSIVLFDSKGARKQARAHHLPLTERAMTIVKRHLTRAEDEELPYLFTNTGKVPVRVETLSGVVSEVSAYLLRHKRAREPFQLRDIRRTCETALAAAGVSKDIRAQILSHGLGGVQDRHYDRHQYMDEKRRALERWDSRLIEIASGEQRENVVPMKRKV